MLSLINVIVMVKIKKCYYLLLLIDFIYQNERPAYMHSTFV
jgi:hypothetical protein